MNHHRPTALLLLAFCAVCLSVTAASDVENGHAEPEEHAEHEFHRNHVAFFVGSTASEEDRPGGEDDARFTLGANYAHRFTRLIGLGVAIEAVPEGEREAVLVAPLFFHVGRRAKIIVGPGAQRFQDSDAISYVSRVGFEYDFHVKRVILTPELNFDLSTEENFAVLGLNIGWGF